MYDHCGMNDNGYANECKYCGGRLENYHLECPSCGAPTEYWLGLKKKGHVRKERMGFFDKRYKPYKILNRICPPAAKFASEVSEGKHQKMFKVFGITTYVVMSIVGIVFSFRGGED